MKRDQATGPAWQVREAARSKLLKKIREDIRDREDNIGVPRLYYLLLAMLARRLECGKIEPRPGHITLIPGLSAWQVGRVTKLFSEITEGVERFQRSEEEGGALLAKLLEQIAAEITRSYNSTLMEQEMSNPKLIYGVERASDEVSLA